MAEQPSSKDFQYFWASNRRATVLQAVPYGTEVEAIERRTTDDGYRVRTMEGSGLLPEAWDAFDDEIVRIPR